MITVEQYTPERTAARRPLVHQQKNAAELPFDWPPLVPGPVGEPVSRPRPKPVPAPIPRASVRVLLGGWFAVMWLFIGLVSSIDAGLTVKHQETLIEMEQNPIARQLLEWEEWNPGVFIGAKFLGTILVLGFLALAYRFHQTMARTIATALAAVQLALLLFLTL